MKSADNVALDAPLADSVQRRVASGLSAHDVHVLIGATLNPIDIETVEHLLTPFTLAHLLHWRLLRTFVVDNERIYLTTTVRGVAMLAMLRELT